MAVETEQKADLAHEVALAMAQWADAMAPVTEVVEGYRAHMAGLGYTPGQARRMAADYHHLLLTQMAQTPST